MDALQQRLRGVPAGEVELALARSEESWELAQAPTQARLRPRRLRVRTSLLDAGQASRAADLFVGPPAERSCG